MLVHRSTTRHIALLVLGVSATLGAGALRAGAGRTGLVATTSLIRRGSPTLGDTLAFGVEYGGIGAEGVDLIWRGYAGGPVPGQVVIRVEYAGTIDERGMPVWPVNVWLFYSADDYRSSFAAELSGSMNWRSGDMQVSGIVSDGDRRGAPLEQRLRLYRPGLGGDVTVVFMPSIALLDGIPDHF
ncbi:MAG TPA: hypothetical protein VMY76_06980 [Gemmatimonadales bacterium]|nr:hypothetical protein [Gemmatimonadales bacterium]